MLKVYMHTLLEVREMLSSGLEKFLLLNFILFNYIDLRKLITFHT